MGRSANKLWWIQIQQRESGLKVYMNTYYMEIEFDNCLNICHGQTAIFCRWWFRMNVLFWRKFVNFDWNFTAWKFVYFDWNSAEVFHQGAIDNNSALVLVMAWSWTDIMQIYVVSVLHELYKDIMPAVLCSNSSIMRINCSRFIWKLLINNMIFSLYSNPIQYIVGLLMAIWHKKPHLITLLGSGLYVRTCSCQHL